MLYEALFATVYNTLNNNANTNTPMETCHYPGHRYELKHMDGGGSTMVQFLQRGPHHEPKEGILCQQLIRILIDRTKVLNSEAYSPLNMEILHHARMMLALFEARAMVRKVEKRHYTKAPESLAVGDDGYWMLVDTHKEPAGQPAMIEDSPVWMLPVFVAAVVGIVILTLITYIALSII